MPPQTAFYSRIIALLPVFEDFAKANPYLSIFIIPHSSDICIDFIRNIWYNVRYGGEGMIRIAIVDDENMVCGGIETIVFQLSKDNNIELETEVYLSGNEFCGALKSREYFNLILLDIEMDNGDGISTGKYLRDELQDDTTQIVYVSGKDGYDRQLFEFHPLGFIEKPVSYDKLNKILKKYLKMFGDENQIFSFKSGHDNHWIHLKDIMYFESLDRKIIIVDSENKPHEFYGTMDNVFDQIKSNGFMMIHKSYIINYRYVREFHSSEIIMDNGKALPISKHRKNEVLKWQLKMETGGKNNYE